MPIHSTTRMMMLYLGRYQASITGRLLSVSTSQSRVPRSGRHDSGTHMCFMKPVGSLKPRLDVFANLPMPYFLAAAASLVLRG
jgi:hypothetical protein